MRTLVLANRLEAAVGNDFRGIFYDPPDSQFSAQGHSIVAGILRHYLEFDYRRN